MGVMAGGKSFFETFLKTLSAGGGPQERFFMNSGKVAASRSIISPSAFRAWNLDVMERASITFRAVHWSLLDALGARI